MRLTGFMLELGLGCGSVARALSSLGLQGRVLRGGVDRSLVTQCRGDVRRGKLLAAMIRPAAHRVDQPAWVHRLITFFNKNSVPWILMLPTRAPFSTTFQTTSVLPPAVYS